MAKLKARIEEFRADARLVDERGPTKEHETKLRPSPINRALADGRLTREQGIAAEKFYAHWYRAGLAENFGSVDLNRIFGGGDGGTGMARTEAQAFHRQRYRAAIKWVTKRSLNDDDNESVIGPGTMDAWVLQQIVCHEKSFVDVGSVFGHKNRNSAAQIAIRMLRPALDILCKGWGII